MKTAKEDKRTLDRVCSCLFMEYRSQCIINGENANHPAIWRNLLQSGVRHIKISPNPADLIAINLTNCTSLQGWPKEQRWWETSENSNSYENWKKLKYRAHNGFRSIQAHCIWFKKIFFNWINIFCTGHMGDNTSAADKQEEKVTLDLNIIHNSQARGACIVLVNV